MRRTHLRGQRGVENDLGIALMTMNLTKLWGLITQQTADINRKIRIIILVFDFKNYNSDFLYFELEKRSFFPASLGSK